MVWGMYRPGAGKFGPYGNEEGEGDGPGRDGWSTRLKEHYKAQTEEEQRRLFYHPEFTPCFHFYPGRVEKKFKHEVGSHPSGANLPITPIEPHEPMRFYVTEKGHKTIPSIISLPSMKWAVDENVKRLIDEMDPGVHHLYPFEIRSPRGKVYPVTYYMFVSSRWLDSFDEEKSQTWKIRDDYWSAPDSKASGKVTLMRRSIFGDAALWWERKLFNDLMCFSDEFAERLIASDLFLPKLFPLQQM